MGCSTEFLIEEIPLNASPAPLFHPSILDHRVSRLSMIKSSGHVLIRTCSGLLAAALFRADQIQKPLNIPQMTNGYRKHAIMTIW